MAKKIVICNNKGGVAKTTTAINIADALIFMGGRVLFIDMDPQMNSSSVFAGEYDLTGAATVRDLLKGNVDINECIMQTEFGDIVLGDKLLENEEDEVYQAARKNPYRLKEALSKIEDDYDFIVCDTPPNIGTMLRNALFAADGLVIPFNAKTFAVDGLGNLLKNIDKIRKEGNKDLKIYGVVLTMYDRRNNQDKKIALALPSLGEAMGFHAFHTCISICQDVENVIADGKSLFKAKGNSAGAVDYVHLAQELLEEVVKYGE